MESALGTQLTERIPWWGKVVAKLVLARLPVPYERWRRLRLFQHGFMLDAGYAERVFDGHFRPVASEVPAGFTVAELGPGDSLATALLAWRAGASRVWLVDAGRFAGLEVAQYRPLLERCAPELCDVSSVDELLARCHATYLTAGLASLREMPSASVDLWFSQAVLEHVVLDEFEETARQMFRTQVPGGRASHRIDLQDHLQHSLHSLRFSPRLWESRAFRTSGFYTNRLRPTQILTAFERAGYRVVECRTDRWPEVPVPRTAMHERFARLPDEELLVKGLDLELARPR